MHYEQFIAGYNIKTFDLINNIKKGILILAAMSYMFYSSVIAFALIGIYLIVCVSTLNIYVEYEYELTENELDIFKISNKKRRKLIKCIKLNNADRPINSEGFNINRYKGAKLIKAYTKKYESCAKQIIILKEANVTNIYELALNEELLGYVSRVK